MCFSLRKTDSLYTKTTNKQKKSATQNCKIGCVLQTWSLKHILASFISLWHSHGCSVGTNFLRNVTTLSKKESTVKYWICYTNFTTNMLMTVNATVLSFQFYISQLRTVFVLFTTTYKLYICTLFMLNNLSTSLNHNFFTTVKHIAKLYVKLQIYSNSLAAVHA